MKRIVVGCLLAGLLAGSTALLAQGKQDFVLVNKTGLVIAELYLSPVNDDKWGEDVLGKDVLKHNEKVTITFPHKATDCMWDLKIVDEDDDDVEWEDINLCKASEITLLYEGKRPTAIIK